MTDGLKDAHREAIIAVIAANHRVERAVLFGSRATGTNTQSSDVDIALFGDRLTLTDQARLAAAIDELPMAQSVDLHLYHSIRQRTLQEHIRRAGVEWYARRRPKRRDGDEWCEVRLGELGEVNRGRSRHRPRHAPELYGGPYPFIQTGDIKASGGRISSHKQTYNDIGLAQSRLWPAGTMVITIAANIAETAILTYPACFPDSVVGFIAADSKCDVRFVEYVFRLLRSEIHQENVGTGSVQDNINLQTLDQLRFSIPTPSVQRAIAEILGTLDDKIELNRRMNATLEAMARALFRSWFVDFDPVRAKMAGRDTGLPKDIADLFPDRLVDSELGEIPKGWRVGHVEDGFDIVMGQSPPGHTYNDTGDGLPFFQGRSDFGFRYPTNRKFCTAPNRVARPWDTLVSVRAPVGDINMAREQCCIGRGVAVLRPRSGAVSYGYCAAQALQPHMREYEHTGTVFGAINRKQLARIPLAQPAADVVRRFEDLVHPWDQMIRLRTAEVSTLTALRDALLPKLVSGELRVTGLEPPKGHDDLPAAVEAHGA